MLLKRSFENIEFLIIIFTIVLVLLGFTVVYLFLFIQKQKEQKHILTEEIKLLKGD